MQSRSAHTKIHNVRRIRGVFDPVAVLSYSAGILARLPHYISRNLEIDYIIARSVEGNLQNGNRRMGGL